MDRADDVELLNLVLNVLVGGVDTTQSQLAHGLRLFAEHPDQWERSRDDPGRWRPNAVDEIVRFEPITPFTARIAMEDVTYRDVTFPRGHDRARVRADRQPRPGHLRGPGHVRHRPRPARAC